MISEKEYLRSNYVTQLSESGSASETFTEST
jgi:hypothetical protein